MSTEIEKIKENERRKDENVQVTEVNKESFLPKNVDSRKIERYKIQGESGMREKIIEHCVYKNGVAKNRIVGTLKNGKLQYGKNPTNKRR